MVGLMKHMKKSKKRRNSMLDLRLNKLIDEKVLNSYQDQVNKINQMIMNMLIEF